MRSEITSVLHLERLDGCVHNALEDFHLLSCPILFQAAEHVYGHVFYERLPKLLRHHRVSLRLVRQRH